MSARSLRGLWLSLLLLLAGSALAAKDSVKTQRDVAYGTHPRHKIDVYAPAQPKGPILLYVHGGGWTQGDKATAAEIQPKVRYWTTLGYVVVSANYRLLPQANPIEQADDVARALAFVQRQAGSWGADGRKVVLMGHSASAHLVSLLTADPARAYRQGAQPWPVTVSLDNPVMDVAALMEAKHAPLYDRVFGKDPAFWKTASPLEAVRKGSPALLMICRQKTDACAQALTFERKSAKHGHVMVIWENRDSHIEITRRLGEPGYYTDSVARWISSIL
jgi:arylformamidase